MRFYTVSWLLQFLEPEPTVQAIPELPPFLSSCVSVSELRINLNGSKNLHISFPKPGAIKPWGKGRNLSKSAFYRIYEYLIFYAKYHKSPQEL